MSRPWTRKFAQSHSSSASSLLSSLELSDTNVYEPKILAPLGTALHFCEVVVLKLGIHSLWADSFPEPSLLPASKLMGVFREPNMPP